MRQIEHVLPSDGLLDRAKQLSLGHPSRSAAFSRLFAAVVALSVAGAGIAIALIAFQGGGDLGSLGPVGSHENGLLAYTTGGSVDRPIVIARANGTPIRTIPAPASGLPWHVAWSPDGQRLAVAVFDDPGGARSLWVINADGSNPVEIASGYNVHRPSWSPDGLWLAYSIDRAATAEIHVVRPNGTDDTVVRSEPRSGTFEIFSAMFSPDGTQILFDEGTDSDFDIFVMDATGSNVRQLTRTGVDYNPAWSPDGRQIVFTRQEGAGSDIFLMDADGSNVRRLTDGGPNQANLNPLFSPDGTTIAYMSTGSGNSNPITEIQLDGSDPKILVDREVLGFSWAPAAASNPSPGNVPQPIQTYEDPLGWSIDFPNDWYMQRIDGTVDRRYDLVGAAFSNEPITRGGSGDPLPDVSTLSPNGVMLIITHREGGPAPTVADDSSFPLDPNDASVLPGPSPLSAVLDFRGDGLEFTAQFGGFADGDRRNMDALKQAITTIRFKPWEPGDVRNGFEWINADFPGDKGRPSFSEGLGIIYVMKLDGETYVLDVPDVSCEGQNQAWDARSQQILLEGPCYDDIRYNPDGSPDPVNAPEYQHSLDRHPVIRAHDGSSLVALNVVVGGSG
jgi:TolB protein